MYAIDAGNQTVTARTLMAEEKVSEDAVKHILATGGFVDGLSP